MEYIHVVRKTDLARNTRQVMKAVQRGQTVIVEEHGQPEAAMMDIIDYHILRAVMRYYANSPQVTENGLSDEAATQLTEPQALYDAVMAHYLAEVISLGRAAELLKLPWIDLRSRFARLDVPLRFAPRTIEEAREDVENAMKWAEMARDQK